MGPFRGPSYKTETRIAVAGNRFLAGESGDSVRVWWDRKVRLVVARVCRFLFVCLFGLGACSSMTEPESQLEAVAAVQAASEDGGGVGEYVGGSLQFSDGVPLDEVLFGPVTVLDDGRLVGYGSSIGMPGSLTRLLRGDASAENIAELQDMPLTDPGARKVLLGNRFLLEVSVGSLGVWDLEAGEFGYTVYTHTGNATGWDSDRRYQLRGLGYELLVYPYDLSNWAPISSTQLLVSDLRWDDLEDSDVPRYFFIDLEEHSIERVDVEDVPGLDNSVDGVMHLSNGTWDPQVSESFFEARDADGNTLYYYDDEFKVVFDGLAEVKREYGAELQMFDKVPVVVSGDKYWTVDKYGVAQQFSYGPETEKLEAEASSWAHLADGRIMYAFNDEMVLWDPTNEVSRTFALPEAVVKVSGASDGGKGGSTLASLTYSLYAIIYNDGTTLTWDISDPAHEPVLQFLSTGDVKCGSIGYSYGGDGTLAAWCEPTMDERRTAPWDPFVAQVIKLELE